jgi:hypothetical protein
MRLTVRAFVGLSCRSDQPLPLSFALSTADGLVCDKLSCRPTPEHWLVGQCKAPVTFLARECAQEEAAAQHCSCCHGTRPRACRPFAKVKFKVFLLMTLV